MRDTLLRAAHGYSYATSNFWRATRGDDTLFITGTNQLNGPRHNAVMQTLLPLLTGVRTLLAGVAVPWNACCTDAAAPQHISPARRTRPRDNRLCPAYKVSNCSNTRVFP